MAKICPVCEATRAPLLGLLQHAKDGPICPGCYQLSPKMESIQTLKQFWEINENRRKKFVQTLSIEGLASKVIIDGQNRLFYFVTDGKAGIIVIPLAKLLDINLYSWRARLSLSLRVVSDVPLLGVQFSGVRVR